MSVICKYCGKTLADNAVFCSGCGTRIEAAVDADGAPAEMESLVPPVITDDMFSTGQRAEAESAEIDSADESEYMKTQPRSIPVTKPAPAVPPPPPAPLLRKPQVQPIIADTAGQPTEEEYRPTTGRFEEAAVPQPQAQQYGQYAQQPRQNQPLNGQFTAAAEDYRQPQPQYGQPMHMPYPDPQRMNVKEGKKGGMLIPIILIILILGVIAFDVFFLFRERIFGSDDSKAKKDIAIVYDIGAGAE